MHTSIIAILIKTVSQIFLLQGRFFSDPKTNKETAFKVEKASAQSYTTFFRVYQSLNK